MRSGWVARLFFGIVAFMGVAAVVSGAACTRWGQPGPTIPSLAPLTQLFVDARTGSDTSGNGSQANPYKTLTKAVAVLVSAKVLSPSGVTITLASGDYDAASGEKFPIVIPKSVTIAGSNYGSGVLVGSFIDGLGEDTTFERLVHAAPHTAYASLVAAAGANVSFSGLYVGAKRLSLPSRSAFYVSLDVLGMSTVSDASFGAGIVSPLKNVNGVLVAGGTFSCSSCSIKANDFGIGGLSVPSATASPFQSRASRRQPTATSPSPSPSQTPSQTFPSITLSHVNTDATVSAKVVDIVTDGSVNVTASENHFLLGLYSYADTLRPVVYQPIRGAVDFGGGAAGSSGGNVFIGARVTEIWVTRSNEVLSALDDTWNPRQQGANRGGLYLRKRVFASGDSGKNVTIQHNATGSTVTVGPAPVPTPSSSPSSSPGPTASAT